MSKSDEIKEVNLITFSPSPSNFLLFLNEKGLLKQKLSFNARCDLEEEFHIWCQNGGKNRQKITFPEKGNNGRANFNETYENVKKSYIDYIDMKIDLRILHSNIESNIKNYLGKKIGLYTDLQVTINEDPLIDDLNIKMNHGKGEARKALAKVHGKTKKHETTKHYLTIQLEKGTIIEWADGSFLIKGPFTCKIIDNDVIRIKNKEDYHG